MTNRDFNATIKVAQSPIEVFDAINNISGWWTPNVAGNSQHLNDEFKVTFGTTWKKFRLVDVVPGKRVEWLVTDCYMPWNEDKTEWTGTRIVWDITKSPDGTQLSFTHIGLVPEVACYEACSGAWTSYIKNSLFKFIFEGVGQPG